MDKKGALELSVNAIVILIIAISMLGLGLGFVRGMFGKTSGQFEELIGAEQDPPTPTGSDPITLSKERVITSPKSPIVVKVGVYNPTGDEWSAIGGGGTLPTMTCLTPFHAAGTPPTGEQKNAKAIKSHESATYSLAFTAPSGTGSAVCNIVVVGKKADGSTSKTLNKELILTVK